MRAAIVKLLTGVTLLLQAAFTATLAGVVASLALWFWTSGRTGHPLALWEAGALSWLLAVFLISTLGRAFRSALWGSK